MDIARSTDRVKHSTTFSATGGKHGSASSSFDASSPSTPSNAGSGSPSSYPTPTALGDHPRAPIATLSISRTQSASSARIHRPARSRLDDASLPVAEHPAGISTVEFPFHPGFEPATNSLRNAASYRSHSSARCSHRVSARRASSLEYALAPTYASSSSANSIAGAEWPSITSPTPREMASASPRASDAADVVGEVDDRLVIDGLLPSSSPVAVRYPERYPERALAKIGLNRFVSVDAHAKSRSGLCGSDAAPSPVK